MAEQTATTTTDTGADAGAAAAATATKGNGQDAPWHASIQDESLRGVASKFKTDAEFLNAFGFEPDNGDPWGELPDELKPVAARFTDRASALRAIADLRKRESTAVRIPGKDAKPEEVAAYRKALEIPDDPKGYEFARPEAMAEETFKSEKVQGVLSGFAKLLHDNLVPKGAAKAIWDFYAKSESEGVKAAVEADKKFLEDSDAALRKDWPTEEEFKANKAYAGRAVQVLAEKAGIPAQDLATMENKAGRYVFDDPRMLRLFAALGREMAEGTLGGAVTDDQRQGIEDQIKTIRAKISEAQGRGDSKEANRLYQTEQELIAKRDGNQPIVGSGARAA